jgi:hypothetical protein
LDADLTTISAIADNYSGRMQDSGRSVTANSNNRISTSGHSRDSSGNTTAASDYRYIYEREKRIDAGCDYRLIIGSSFTFFEKPATRG